MFTDAQKALLDAPLSRAHVKTRTQSNRTLSYLESWVAISEANRIFGFDGWSRETVDYKCVSEKERKIVASGADGWSVTYIAKVRVTIPLGDGNIIIREGCGAGHGIDRDLGQAHESALKEAESDSGKRALMTFGNPFGLALYDKDQVNVEDAPRPVYAAREVTTISAPKPTPQKEPAPPAPNVSDDVKRKAARTFATKAIQNMENYIDIEKFSEWADTNNEQIARVRVWDPTLHTLLTQKIKDTYERLNQ